MSKVSDITPIENRNAIQVLTDVAKSDPEMVVVVYTDAEGNLMLQANGLSHAEVVYQLELAKTSVVMG